jgi:hypothetical protein
VRSVRVWGARSQQAAVTAHAACRARAQSTPEGLTDEQVAERIKEYGPNKLPESNRSPFLQFLGYLWNPLSWAMEAAAIIAIVLLDFADFALILFLLLLNAVISFREESSAVRARAPRGPPGCRLPRACAGTLVRSARASSRAVQALRTGVFARRPHF